MLITNTSTRQRIRDLLPGIRIGDWQPGALNSLTDVKGVKVHTQEIFSHDGSVNTGVTCILPRDEWADEACYSGIFSFNGAGEMTGSHWINETGLLHSPIVITNTFSVGAAHQGIYEYAIKSLGAQEGKVSWFMLPVVCETFDGYLNDVAKFAVKPEHIVRGLERATSERVREGNVGGGTGMICHLFKGGTGSSSRLVPGFDSRGGRRTFTIGALVQANYGKKQDFRIVGVPVGRILAENAIEEANDDSAKKAAQEEQCETAQHRKDGSIIVILATDAPLNPTQLQRIAKRATVGLARVGGQGHNSSGDIFLAFSTGNKLPVQNIASKKRLDTFSPKAVGIEVIDDTTIDGLLEAAADATEEAIYNALCMAETMVGNQGHKIEALPLERVEGIMEKYL